MNAIKWKAKASRQLQKIKDAATQKGIYLAVQELAGFPECANIKKLVNHAYPYRLRVGNYRVFFSFDGEIHIIFVEEVKKRDEHTY
jgi:mRNA-degrading endonuclease RelE of RelBE toxin-antitoxin system